MAEIEKVWSCIKLALKNSWERYGSYTVLATFVGTIAVFLVKNYPATFSQKWCDAINYWVLIIPIGLFAISFIFNFWKAHSQIAKDLMTVEGISLAMPSFPRYFCQIRVHNRTPNTADNVRVELTEMESSTEENERHLLPRLPLVLLPAETSDTITINPGGNLAFNLFNVTKHKSAHAPNLHVWIHWIMAKFVVGANEEQTALGNAALFHNNRNYHLKIRVTARDFCPTESEFNLNFTGEESQCRFTLTPVK